MTDRKVLSDKDNLKKLGNRYAVIIKAKPAYNTMVLKTLFLMIRLILIKLTIPPKLNSQTLLGNK